MSIPIKGNWYFGQYETADMVKRKKDLRHIHDSRVISRTNGTPSLTDYIVPNRQLVKGKLPMAVAGLPPTSEDLEM